MSDLSIHRVDQNKLPPLPPAKLPGAISVRKATMDDYPFIDALQKDCPGQLGFQYESALFTRIEQGNILIAEVGATSSEQSTVNSEQGKASDGPSVHCSLGTVDSPAPPVPVGYVLGVDRYYKRDDLGVIYQMAVLPEYRRSLVAAHLLKAKFEDSAYGCKLYCCWCAQDLVHANKFWEAMGFVPLAFRTGSEKTRFVNARGEKCSGGRIHIFWQKRIRLGDNETPWWYPSETSGGAIGANRIALPIPPGTHWSDAKPVVLPPELVALPPAEEAEEEPHAKAQRRKGKAEPPEDRAKKNTGKVESAEETYGGGGSGGGGLGGFAVGFGPTVEEVEAREQAKEDKKRAKKAAKKAKRARLKKNDPALCAFSRELRDRWQEHVEAQPGLIEGAAQARYKVGRLLQNAVTVEVPEIVSEVVPGAEVKRLDAA